MEDVGDVLEVEENVVVHKQVSREEEDVDELDDN
jgi:hypothetical protein